MKPKQVKFKSEDGLEIHGQLFVPAERRQAGPALIFVHGGPIRQMMLGFHYMYYYHNAYAMNQYLASRGYVVLSVNYRLGIMYARIRSGYVSLCVSTVPSRETDAAQS